VSSVNAALSRPLKFRDDVFVNDRIVAGDQSMARMLLGGRAVVTVRERSALTITEVPGKSTIALEAGKIAVAVARERMKPGDLIEVRTPNAVAGVRGTVFVVEVMQAAAALEADATPTTYIYGFAGEVAVNAANQVFTVGPNTVLSRIGVQLPILGPLTADLRVRAEAGLHVRPPIVGGAGQRAANEAAMNATLAALAGSNAAVGNGSGAGLKQSSQNGSAPILPGGVSTIPILTQTTTAAAPPPPPPPQDTCQPPTYGDGYDRYRHHRYHDRR
jgi:hypothetical protein